jgi:hypothetical protein
MGFVEHLKEFVGREGKLEGVPASKHGARYTYLLEFTPLYSGGGEGNTQRCVGGGRAD